MKKKDEVFLQRCVVIKFKKCLFKQYVQKVELIIRNTEGGKGSIYSRRVFGLCQVCNDRFLIYFFGFIFCILELVRMEIKIQGFIDFSFLFFIKEIGIFFILFNINWVLLVFLLKLLFFFIIRRQNYKLLVLLLWQMDI